MKKLALSLSVLPAVAHAHGGHAPVPEAYHGLTHMALGAGAAILVVALGVIVIRRWRA